MGLIVEKIVSIFLIMAVGFVANRTGVLPREGNKFLTNLLIKVIAPCMIFSSITSKELTDDTFAATLYTLLGAALFSVCAAVLGWVLCKYLLRVSPLEDVGVYAFVFASLNSGFMGFPITLALFGQDILYFMVVHNITLTLYLYTLGPIILSMSSQGSQKKSAFDLRSLLASLLNINTIVAFVSIILLFAGLHLPALLFESIETIGNATVPISMLLVGVQLGESNPLKIIKNGKLVAISVLKMFLLPVLTFLAVNWLPILPEVKLCMTFAAVFPGAVAAVPVVAIEGKNSLTCAEMVAFTTFLSVATVPLFAAFLMHWYGF